MKKAKNRKPRDDYIALQGRYVFYYSKPPKGSGRWSPSTYIQYEVIVSETASGKPYLTPQEFDKLVYGSKSFKDLEKLLKAKGNLIMGKTGSLGIEFNGLYKVAPYRRKSGETVTVGIRKLKLPEPK